MSPFPAAEPNNTPPLSEDQRADIQLAVQQLRTDPDKARAVACALAILDELLVSEDGTTPTLQ